MNEITQIDIAQQQASIMAEAQLVEISDEPTMNHAQGLLVTLKKLKKNITEYIEPSIEGVRAAKDAVYAMRKSLLAPADKAEEIVRGKLKQFGIDEDKRRVAAEKKIADDQAAAAAEAAKNAPPPVEGAEALMPVAPPPVVKVASVTDKGFRDNWQFEITDPDLIPRLYLVPDIKAIGGVVRAQKEKCEIPGIHVFNERTPVARG